MDELERALAQAIVNSYSRDTHEILACISPVLEAKQEIMCRSTCRCRRVGTGANRRRSRWAASQTQGGGRVLRGAQRGGRVHRVGDGYSQAPSTVGGLSRCWSLVLNRCGGWCCTSGRFCARFVCGSTGYRPAAAGVYPQPCGTPNVTCTTAEVRRGQSTLHGTCNITKRYDKGDHSSHTASSRSHSRRV